MSKMGPKYVFYSKISVLVNHKLLIVAYKSARERKSGKVTNILNEILIPSYNGEVPIVHC